MTWRIKYWFFTTKSKILISSALVQPYRSTSQQHWVAIFVHLQPVYMHGTVLCISTYCAGAWSSKTSTDVCLVLLHLSSAGLADALSVLVCLNGSATRFCSLPTTVSIDAVLLSWPPKQDSLRWIAYWHWSLASDKSGVMPKSCFRRCLLAYSKLMPRISFYVWWHRLLYSGA